MQGCGAWTIVSSLNCALSVSIADLSTRQDKAPVMALHASSMAYSYSTLGDAAFSSHAEGRSISSS